MSLRIIAGTGVFLACLSLLSCDDDAGPADDIATLKLAESTVLHPFDDPSSVFAVDLDGKAPLELILHSQSSGKLAVCHMDPEGDKWIDETYQVEAPLFHVSVGDLNGDGLSDLVATHPKMSYVTVLMAVEGGGYRLDSLAADCGPFYATQFHDLDGDGLEDLFVGSSAKGLWRVKYDEQGYAWTEIPGEPTSALGLAVGDLDDDGLEDLAVAGFPYGDGVLFAAADSSRRWHKLPGLGRSCGVELLDVDRDGDVDMIFNSISGDSSAIAENLGGGRFDFRGLTDSPHAPWTDIADLDQDGRYDFVVIEDNALKVYEKMSDPEFGVSLDVEPQRQFIWLDLADADNDGDVDILTICQERKVAVMIENLTIDE